jgi:hypothetical protein
MKEEFDWFAHDEFMKNLLLYHETKNPLFMWEIYRIYREEKSPIPEIILKYFDSCAANLKKIDETGDLRNRTLQAFGFDFKKGNNNSPFAKKDLNLRNKGIRELWYFLESTDEPKEASLKKIADEVGTTVEIVKKVFRSKRS